MCNEILRKLNNGIVFFFTISLFETFFQHIFQKNQRYFKLHNTHFKVSQEENGGTA